MSSAWKVAYADFVTALMAFFLLMWVLNMVPPETKQGLAEYFAEEATLQTSSTSPISNNSLVNATDRLDLRNTPLTELKKSQLAIIQKLQSMIMADAVPRSASGISSDDIGVQLRVNSDAMFDPGSTDLTDSGRKVLDSVLDVLREYNVYLVVRGHADAVESAHSAYASPWDLSAARAAATVRYLTERGITPTRLRAVAYADTRPVEPGTSEASLRRNRRVEFYFHRPEAGTASMEY